MENTFNNRLDRIENKVDAMQRELHALSVSSVTASAPMDARVRALEVEFASTRLVVRGVSWLAATVCGGAVIMVLTYLFGRA